MKISLLGRLSHCRAGSRVGLIELARELGVPGLELSEDRSVTGEELREIRGRMAAAGITPVSLHIPVHIPAPEDPSQSDSLQRARSSLERAVLLGARTIVFSPFPSSPGSPIEQTRLSFEQRVAELMPDVIRLALQPTFNNSGNHAACFGKADYCRHLCERFAPLAGMTFDVGNVVLAGEDWTAVTAQLAPWIRVVHVKDWEVRSGTPGPDSRLRSVLLGLRGLFKNPAVRKTARRAFRMFGLGRAVDQSLSLFQGLDGQWYSGAVIGEGIMDPFPLLEQLRQLGYTGYLSVEYEGGGDLRTAYRLGAERLRELLDQLSSAGPA